ncbi:MAG: acylphosphatase [Thiotrichaceae bacterium]
MKICKHCLISGHVQGVAFRYYTRKEAMNLNLTGWVRNLSDGRVEVWVYGEEAAVMKFSSWLSQGPATAQVIEVQCKTMTTNGNFESFEITG